MKEMRENMGLAKMLIKSMVITGNLNVWQVQSSGNGGHGWEHDELVNNDVI
jgi:hypothetical protein